MTDRPSHPTPEQLVQEHYELVYRYAYRLSGSAADAEDLTQQTFLHAHTHLDSLREPQHAKAWLCSILRRCYLKERRQHRPVSLCGSDGVLAADRKEPEDEWGELDSEGIQAALNELPEEFRTPVILFYFHEFSYRQIAQFMEIPIGTVMSRLARGKAHLRARLNRKLASTNWPLRSRHEL